MQKTNLYRVPLNLGDYDASRFYWGRGASLYCAHHPDSGASVYVRADNREAAKQEAIEELWRKHAVRDYSVEFYR